MITNLKDDIRKEIADIKLNISTQIQKASSQPSLIATAPPAEITNPMLINHLNPRMFVNQHQVIPRPQ